MPEHPGHQWPAPARHHSASESAASCQPRFPHHSRFLGEAEAGQQTWEKGGGTESTRLCSNHFTPSVAARQAKLVAIAIRVVSSWPGEPPFLAGTRRSPAFRRKSFQVLQRREDTVAWRRADSVARQAHRLGAGSSARSGATARMPGSGEVAGLGHGDCRTRGKRSRCSPTTRAGKAPGRREAPSPCGLPRPRPGGSPDARHASTPRKGSLPFSVRHYRRAVPFSRFRPQPGVAKRLPPFPNGGCVRRMPTGRTGRTGNGFPPRWRQGCRVAGGLAPMAQSAACARPHRAALYERSPSGSSRGQSAGGSPKSGTSISSPSRRADWCPIRPGSM